MTREKEPTQDLIQRLIHLHPCDRNILWQTIDPQPRQPHIEQIFRDRNLDDIDNPMNCCEKDCKSSTNVQ